MAWQRLADAVLLLHLGFILFAVLGGFAALRWRWLVWLHLPAAAWAAAIEFGGWTCPLTPLEGWLRVQGGGAGYAGGFIEHHVQALIYPAGLTRTMQLWLGAFVIAINLVAYALLLGRRRRAQA